MNIKFDEQADALYIKLNNSQIIDSEEILDSVTCDYDINGTIVGVEVINIKQQPIDLYKKIAHLFSVEELGNLKEFFNQKRALLN
jgi:uncharacterized protein YuzE